MTDLHTDVERYLRYLSVERQLSAKTVCKAGSNVM